MAMFIVKPWYRKKEVDLFGTPSSNSPIGGSITADVSALSGAELYKVFGSNTGFCKNQASGSANIYYRFTDGSMFKPVSLTYCTYYTASHGWAESPTFHCYASNDGGSTWDLLFSTTTRTNRDVSETVAITANKYYDRFRFYFYSPTGQGWTGAKGIAIKGIKS